MGSDKIKKILFKGDKIIWAVFFIICAISWIEGFSAISRQVYKSGNYWGPILKHSGFLLSGVFVVWFMHNMRVAWIKKLTFVIYWLGLAGLVWAQFSSKINDSARWISVFGMTFQPMELAKMGLIMVTALIITEHQDENGTDRFALKKILLYSSVPVLLILKENLSTAMIILLSLYMMMFIARFPGKQLLVIMASAIVTVVIGLTAIMLTPESAANDKGIGQKVVTWKHRIVDALGSKPVSPEEYVVEGNEQRTYANIAIASSHIIGVGPGNSVQRDFIPHAYSDFIYAVIIEELGLLGGIVVLLLYMTILYRCGKIAKNCEDPYPAFLIMGIGLIVTMQALMHMYISVGNFVTGQPLPLISQGGTSILINCVYIGMILSISRYARRASLNPAQANRELTEITTNDNNEEYEERV